MIRFVYEPDPGGNIPLMIFAEDVL